MNAHRRLVDSARWVQVGNRNGVAAVQICATTFARNSIRQMRIAISTRTCSITQSLAHGLSPDRHRRRAQTAHLFRGTMYDSSFSFEQEHHARSPLTSAQHASFSSADWLKWCDGAQSHDNSIQVAQKLVAIDVVKCGQHDLIDFAGCGFEVAQRAPAFVSQLYCVGASVFACASALQKILLEHSADDVGESRAVDAGLLDEMRLAEALIHGHGYEHGKLAGRQVRSSKFVLKNVACALPCPMQEMNWRTFQFCRYVRIRLLGLCHFRAFRSVRLDVFFVEIPGRIHIVSSSQ